MARRIRTAACVAALAATAALVAGCPLKFEKESGDNAAPFTFFEVSPPDTTFRNEVFFRWLGTDLDSDVVAYQYQLVRTDREWFETAGQSGRVLESIDPRGFPPPPTAPDYDEEDRIFFLWNPRQTDNFQTAIELDDGWYEMRARAIDDRGKVSPEPARSRFFVFFDDIPPTPIIVDPRPGTTTPACGRIGQVTSWTFFLTATDESRNDMTPRSRLEYSYQLRARSSVNCTTHLADSFTPWRLFPDDSDTPIQVGNGPPTLYTDLLSPNCGWDFTLRVRDPAGNTASVSCCISRGTGCAGG